jgi:hypothetical protein
MYVVQLRMAATRQQIEIPKKVGKKLLERSVDGSLHFIPGRVKTITNDEYEYIKENEKKFATQVIVLREKPDPKPELDKEKIGETSDGNTPPSDGNTPPSDGNVSSKDKPTKDKPAKAKGKK